MNEEAITGKNGQGGFDEGDKFTVEVRSNENGSR